jgi:alkane 1-monooxygenase
MKFEGVADNGETITYIDGKRWWWTVGFFVNLVVIASLAVFIFIEPNLWLLTVGALVFYGFIPACDFLIGGDTENPPEEVVPAMTRDKFYDYIAYAMIPGHFILFGLGAYIVATHSLPIWAYIVLLLSIGPINGGTMNLAHELGHRTDPANRFFAKLSLMLSGYGHFTIEHNAGHHVWVATPEDPASSKMGESIYTFMWRELPLTLSGAFKLQSRKLKAQGLPFFHWKNDILQVYAVTILTAVALVLWLGWAVLPFILLHHFLVWYSLTQANYIEHYGLLRKKLPNGKYEKCQPKHSWNTNHRVSNLFSLHLQRHSDHHANPMRPYQALRDFEDVSVLPSGYPGCFALAAVPQLWFAVMDPRVIDWADGDIDAIHMTYKKRAQLERQAAIAAE